MSNAPNPWTSWWQRERISSDRMWQRAAEIFVQGSTPLLDYHADDVVLDIGCGRGHVAALLADRVAGLDGVDVSEGNLEICRHKFAGRQNFAFHKLDPLHYTDLSFLERRYSVILCVSVVQFYRNQDEVAELLNAIGRVAKPGARVLIADLPTGPLGPGDLAHLLWTGARERLLGEVARYLVRALGSDYRQLTARQGLLCFSGPTLRRLSAELGPEARLLTTRLSLNPERLHLLLRLPDRAACVSPPFEQS